MEILVEWKDRSNDWVPLKDLKKSNPVYLAEYAVANEISDEPDFNWWIKENLRHRDRIISKVKSKYWRTSHKFGIQVPKTVKEAYYIDRQSGTDFWTKSIGKDMKNFHIVFEKLDGVTPDDMRKGKIKPGYEHINIHMIFDINIYGKFTRKSRLVDGGHKTAPPSSISYSSVVYRESVSIAFLLAYLNDLDIFACDIGNAYLNAKCREKLRTESGTEFGTEKKTVMIIARVIYGLKSSGAAWRSKLAETLMLIRYKSSEADADVWMKR